MKKIFFFTALVSFFNNSSALANESGKVEKDQRCPVSYSRSDCSKVPGIIISSITNPDGIVEISCEGQFAITSCSANGDSSSSNYKHWQGLARCIPLTSLQENCSAARVGNFDVSAPVVRKICPSGTYADCDWSKKPKCECLDL